MRDVIGQDDLEAAAPPSGAGRGRRAAGVAAGALLVAGAVAVGTGGVTVGTVGLASGTDGAASRTDGAASSRGTSGGESARGTSGVRGAPGSRSQVGGDAGRTGAGAVRPGPPVPADPALRGSLAARPLGGRTVHVGVGARGEVRLEIRNGGAPLQLRALTAEVPGVRFAQVVGPRGVRLDQDQRVELVLGFRIDDCEQLRRTGRLVLLVEQAGAQHEVGLTITHDREAGTVRQVALDRVLGACPD